MTFNWKCAPTILLLHAFRGSVDCICVAGISPLYKYTYKNGADISLEIPQKPCLDGNAFVSLKVSISDDETDRSVRLSKLSGAPYIVVIIDIPQRSETAGVDAFGAGVRLIPFNFLITLGAVAANIIAGKSKMPTIMLLSVGVVFQIIGVCLL